MSDNKHPDTPRPPRKKRPQRINLSEGACTHVATENKYEHLGLRIQHETLTPISSGQFGSTAKIRVTHDPDNTLDSSKFLYVLKSLMVPDAGALSELTRELDIALKIHTLTKQHACLATIYGLSGALNRGIVMEYYPDGDLAHWVQSKETKNAADTFNDFIRPIVSGLTYLHDSGWAHRDLKPANILLNGKNAVITDFGTLDEFLELEQKQIKPSFKLKGSLCYWAPEVLDSNEINENTLTTQYKKIDWFAVGLIILVLLNRPYPGQDIMDSVLPNEEHPEYCHIVVHHAKKLWSERYNEYYPNIFRGEFSGDASEKALEQLAALLIAPQNLRPESASMYMNEFNKLDEDITRVNTSSRKLKLRRSSSYTDIPSATPKADWEKTSANKLKSSTSCPEKRDYCLVWSHVSTSLLKRERKDSVARLTSKLKTHLTV